MLACADHEDCDENEVLLEQERYHEQAIHLKKSHDRED